MGIGKIDRYREIPTVISVLPKINKVSCGGYFTVCVDYEGFMWGFGSNSYNQLGKGEIDTSYNIPQKIEDVPPVQDISCGFSHTIILTNDENLWSCGWNQNGQLCLGNQVNQQKPKQTLYSNIGKISAGNYHSLFQNNKGEIFGCGCTSGINGVLHNQNPQVDVKLVLSVQFPPIIQFCCGMFHSLFLDVEGNVFYIGWNKDGSLGLGHNTDTDEIKKIPNIPPMQTISCAGPSSYLIDPENNIWSFGNNRFGQLGHGDDKSRNTPTKIMRNLIDIQQISHGSCSNHFLAKDYQNKIFTVGVK